MEYCCAEARIIQRLSIPRNPGDGWPRLSLQQRIAIISLPATSDLEGKAGNFSGDAEKETQHVIPKCYLQWTS